MVAAQDFLEKANATVANMAGQTLRVRCQLRGSLAYTGKGHGTDCAVMLGLNGYRATDLSACDINALVDRLRESRSIRLACGSHVHFAADNDIEFDCGPALPEHPNGLIFKLLDDDDQIVLMETYFSIGGGFVQTKAEIDQIVAPLNMHSSKSCRFPFDSANAMLAMADESGLSIAQMKMENELAFYTPEVIEQGLNNIWEAMRACIERGLSENGTLPGGLHLARRAKVLYQQLMQT